MDKKKKRMGMMYGGSGMKRDKKMHGGMNKKRNAMNAGGMVKSAMEVQSPN